MTKARVFDRIARNRQPKQQGGMSLVELMVGVAIGLFIVAAATLMVGNQLSDNRRLILETQLQQDMRATMDIMTRQIRRSGVRIIDESISLIALSGGQPGSFDPEYTGIDIVGGNEITFDYHLNPTTDARLKPNTVPKNWGFRLQNERVKTSLADSGWQDLTDRSTVKVTGLTFVENSSPSEVVACPNLCPDGTTDCWPRFAVRTYTITLEAESATDPLVKRRMQSVARVRANLPVFNTSVQPCPP